MAYEQLDPNQAKEIISFQISYNKQHIRATWILAVVIAVLYLLEEFFGGSQNVAVLVRMGANVSERVKDGEYYRLLSSVFLHAGLMHVFFNTYVLFALGGFFNRILGEARFLTVFLFSGICGSLASVFFGKSAVSVGASGAIWGLFGVSLALAFFKTSLIPEPIRLQLRRVTFINLLINLGISFLPMIDLWAHLGGGIGGFLISLWIIVSSRDETTHRISAYMFRALAVILSLVYAASIVYGLWTFKPWVNQLTSELKQVELAHVPFVIAIPSGLKEMVNQKNTDKNASFVFGNPDLDRMVVELNFFHESLIGGSASDDWLVAQQQALMSENSVPAELKKSLYLRENGDEKVLYFQQKPKSGDVLVHNYLITRGEYAIKLLFVVSDKISQAQVDAIATKVIKSLAAK